MGHVHVGESDRRFDAFASLPSIGKARGPGRCSSHPPAAHTIQIDPAGKGVFDFENSMSRMEPFFFPLSPLSIEALERLLDRTSNLRLEWAPRMEISGGLHGVATGGIHSPQSTFHNPHHPHNPQPIQRSRLRRKCTGVDDTSSIHGRQFPSRHRSLATRDPSWPTSFRRALVLIWLCHLRRCHAVVDSSSKHILELYSRLHLEFIASQSSRQATPTPPTAHNPSDPSDPSEPENPYEVGFPISHAFQVLASVGNVEQGQYDGYYGMWKTPQVG